jgi:hypothetical protein
MKTSREYGPRDLVVSRLYVADKPLVLSRLTREGVPAVLVIPRSELLHEPHIMLAFSSRAGRVGPPGRLVSADPHVVAVPPSSGAHREMADVLVVRRSGDRRPADELVTGTLARYPGAEVCIGSHPGGCLAALRAGVLVEISGATDQADVSVLGSFLHCWSVAGLPLAGLESSAVALGMLVAAESRACVLADLGSVKFSLLRSSVERRAVS